MKRLTSALIFFAVALGTIQAANSTNENPLWMRYPNISPDGSQIAFAYRGDIYTVSTSGGEARRITATPAFDSQPIWSHDGKTIAFASDRFGGMDIFTVAAEGGKAVRVTNHSRSEIPLAFSTDNKYIYFSASIQDPASSILWAAWMTELYKVKTTGGRAEQILANPVCSISFDKDGESFLYYDRTGSENIWRKHHTSSVARNIFYYNAADGSHTLLTANPGEDRDPIFAGEGKMVFLSERNGGSFNVYESAINDSENAKALTNFKNHPVRFLSRADNGTLCFGYHGEIYTLTNGDKAKKVNISILDDYTVIDETLRPTSVSDIAISDDGKEIILMTRGEVFATTDKYETTKQLSHTAAAEKGLTISPDGKTVVYASERNGCWNLYKAELARKEDLHFAYATLIDETPLFPDNGVERANPLFSPDGKELAFIENRNFLKVLNLEKGKVRDITNGEQHYSNNEYGFEYQWSPDGKWFALTFYTNRRYPYSDIGIVSAVDGGEIHNVTNSAYIDSSPQWVMDGNAIIFTSNRLGMRAHASWGSQDDVFIAFMNQETYDKFNMNEEEYELYKEREKLAKESKEKEEKAAEKKEAEQEKAGKAKGDKKEVKGNKGTDNKGGKGNDKDGKDGEKGSKDGEKDAKSKDIEIDFACIEDRIQRLTPMSSNLASAALSKDGEKLYFLSSFEKGYDLWEKNTRSGSISLIKKLNTAYAYLQLDKDGKKLYILGSRPQIMTLGDKQVKPLDFRINMELDRAAEREYMFNHVFKQQKEKFYRSDYHGVDLDKLQKDYKPFLAHINNNYDFSEMLSEILGELNVSHTGSGYSGIPAQKQTPEFGLLFDMHYKGKGLKIDEILAPGPFSSNSSKVRKGCVLEKIDGKEINAEDDYFPLINGKTNELILFSFYDPASKSRWDESVKLISRSEQQELLYKRWVKSRAAAVDSLSGGRLGYVHIRSMADASYRDIYADILGKYNLKDGIVIDTRYNGGGRLHEDIEILFSGTKYLEQTMQGTVICDMPSRRYNKHSIMLVGEANYSNAHGTPWVYKQMGIGSVVGMPVPGTMTSVNWETLQDSSMYFGIPVVGYRTKEGEYLENMQLEPDFKVRNKVEEAVNGRDEQLEVAVQELLKQIDADGERW